MFETGKEVEGGKEVRTRSGIGVAVALGVVLLVVGSPLSAHQSDQSLQMTEVRGESGEVEQLLSVSAEDLAHHLGLVGHGEFPAPAVLATNRQLFEDYLNQHTLVRADGQDCELRESRFIAFPGQDGRVHFHQLWQCPEEPARVMLGNQVMFSGHGGYRHMGRIQVGEEIFATVFDRNYPTYTVDLNPEVALGEGWPGEEGSEGGGPGEKRRINWLVVLAIMWVVGTLIYWFRSR